MFHVNYNYYLRYMDMSAPTPCWNYKVQLRLLLCVERKKMHAAVSESVFYCTTYVNNNLQPNIGPRGTKVQTEWKSLL